ncbi:MAG: histidine phosphatase family protein [Cognatishimia sp.]|uniref:histidine phosphatase family protein n=1 Tax=Cognatishimia sp. TaxID=2211648 RepID=UPI0040597BB0
MLQATRFVVIRHGESDANRKGIISDKYVDHPLTELGLQQARQTAELLHDAKLDVIFSSTRRRAISTSRIVNEFHVVDIMLCPELIERDYGTFGGKDKYAAENEMLKQGFGWFDIPESETTKEMDRRVALTIKRAILGYNGKTILVSTHEDIVRTFYRILAGKSESESLNVGIPNCSAHTFATTSFPITPQ